MSDRDEGCKHCGADWGLEGCLCEDVEDEQDFLDGKTCNPDAPEECESCQ